MKKEIKKLSGFTLIELLIVIAVIAVLGSLVFVALNPLARFQDSRNAKRWGDANSILSAIKLDQIDNGGAYHDNITAMTDNTYYQIGEGTTGCDTTCLYPTVSMQSACVDLLDLIDEGYIADMPLDPNLSGVSADAIGYYIYKYNSGQISIGACNEEQGSNSSIQVIEVSR